MSAMVELAVEALVLVTVAVDLENADVPVVLSLVQLVVSEDTVDDVVTAYVIVETVVETVGPSGCLIRPILRPPYSVNHTFTAPPASV